MSNYGEEKTSIAAEDNEEQQSTDAEVANNYNTSVIPVKTVNDDNTGAILVETVQDEVEETGVDNATETMDVETTRVDTTNNSTTTDTATRIRTSHTIRESNPEPWHYTKCAQVLPNSNTYSSNYSEWPP